MSYRDADGKQLYGVLRYPVGYEKGKAYPTVFELYETFFDNGFNARAAFLANHGYAVFHPSVNLVVGRPGEAWVKGVTSAANRLIEMGVADPDRLGVHGTSYGGYATVLLHHADRSVQGGRQRVGQGGHGQLLHRQPAPRRAQHARAGEEPGPDRRHAVGIPGALPRALGDPARGSHQDAAAVHHRRPGSERARRASRARSTTRCGGSGRTCEWVRYVNGAHRPPNSVAESVDFEQRILGGYDKYLKAPTK